MAWWTGKVKCRVCGHEHVSVIETDDGENLDDQECPNCHCVSCDPIEEDEEAEFA